VGDCKIERERVRVKNTAKDLKITFKIAHNISVFPGSFTYLSPVPCGGHT